MDEKPSLPADLLPIPGDTYPLRTELKALGAIWDPSERVWRIAADKLALATALVENQALVPEPAPPTDESGELLDPFEQDTTPKLVPLEKRDGATYEARDTLRAIGARWDKDRRSWMIREERAEYARAVLASAAGAGAAPAPARPAPLEPLPRTPERKPETRPAPTPAASPAPTVSGDKAPAPSNRITLGGLWSRKTRDGREYLTGKLSPTVSLLIFPNDSTAGENQPSHTMYLAPVAPDETAEPDAATGTAFYAPAAAADDDYFPAESAPPSRRGNRAVSPPPAGGRARSLPPQPAPDTIAADDLQDRSDPFED